MLRQSQPLALVSKRYSPTHSLKLLALVLATSLVLQAANTARAQNLSADPLFGSTNLESGFTSAPYTVEVSPGGTDAAFNLGESCTGYIRFAQPDFVLSYQAESSPLGVFASSDLDITMAINDPAGDWHCNDDHPYLSGTNSGIQFSEPLSGDYQIWVGSYESGADSIATLLAITEVDETEWASISIGLEDAVYAASFDLNGDIVFGDDSSGFANDGECDDARFQGPGAAFGSSSDHLFKDATDCRTQFDAGMVSLAEPEDMNFSGNMDTNIFGGDADIFTGDTSAASPLDFSDAGPFGEVMFALLQAFQAIPGDDAGAMPLPFGLGGASDYDRAAVTELTGIDFGDNSGPFVDDGECDDPRFEGPGASDFSFEEGELTDAGDCSSLYLEGSLTYIDPASVDSASVAMDMDSTSIDFGNDSSLFANDGECDDPRFEGPGAASFSTVEDEMRDASDCRTMFESGQVSLIAQVSSAPSTAASTPSARTGTSQPVQETYVIGTPRGDIDGATLEDGSIYASGTVYGEPLNPNDSRGYAMPINADVAPASTPSAPNATVDFGDNSSVWANDGECDDPRFEGNGMAAATLDEDRGRDAVDCRAAYEAGTITLIRN